MDEAWGGFYILNRLGPLPTGALLKAPPDGAASGASCFIKWGTTTDVNSTA